MNADQSRKGGIQVIAALRLIVPVGWSRPFRPAAESSVKTDGFSRWGTFSKAALRVRHQRTPVAKATVFATRVSQT
jgi:hypothetical protein